MAGEVVQRPSGDGKGKLRRRKRRISVRIDMTPMVDIAFLLLIFYMVTTIFAMPQAMQINLPPGDDVIEVSKLLTIRVDQQGRYWWNLGQPSLSNLPQILPPIATQADPQSYNLNSDALRSLLLEQNRKYSNLNTLILIHRDAPFEAMVNILDEIDVIERAWNNFRAEQAGKDPTELDPEERFSYRYALDEWSGADDRLIVDAVNANQRGGL